MVVFRSSRNQKVGSSEVLERGQPLDFIMRIRELSVGASPEIVTRFPEGFVMRFGHETCGIAALFVHHLQKVFGSAGVGKIAFIFTDETDSPPERFYELNCVCPFDFSSYVSADLSVKRSLIARALKEALKWCAPHVGWPAEGVEKAYDLAIADGLILEGFSKKTWLSPARDYRVKVWYTMDVDRVTLDVTLFRVRGGAEVARKRLPKQVPYTACLAHYIDSGAWISQTGFALKSESFPPQTWEVDFADEMRNYGV